MLCIPIPIFTFQECKWWAQCATFARHGCAMDANASLCTRAAAGCVTACASSASAACGNTAGAFFRARFAAISFAKMTNLSTRPLAKSSRPKASNANLAIGMANILVLGAKFAFAMTMSSGKAWNMRKTRQFLARNAVMKLLRPRDWPWVREIISLVGNNLEARKKGAMRLHIMHGKVSTSYLLISLDPIKGSEEKKPVF